MNSHKTHSKFVGVRVPIEMYDKLSAIAESEHRTLSNFIKKVLAEQLDETDYLLSSKTNKKRLLAAKRDIEAFKVREKPIKYSHTKSKE